MKLKQNETYVRVQYFKWGKKIDIITNKNEQEFWIHKEKLAEGGSTSSKIVQTIDGIFIKGPIENL